MIETGIDKKASATPFPAIVGQDELKRALLAVGTDPALGGLLVRGEKGTAKSTAVRALADLLPDQRAVADCPYGCPPADPGQQCIDCRERDDPPVETRSTPLVTVPLGATRERVVGTLSVADALAGEAEFDPGLLARANRGILYVDEVNLLDDHLVDVLLDAAASGVNRVERDGVSVTHPAEFTLVGTMNPEEGDLRPQLRDRFALQATVAGCPDIDDRVEIIDRALARDDAPRRFAGGYENAVADLRERLRTARSRRPEVSLPDEFKRDIAQLCRDAGVEGHRADIATARAAATLAALADRSKVVESDLRAAAELTLPHRLRSRPFEDAPDPEDILDDHFDDGDDGTETDEGDEADQGGGDSDASEDGAADGEGEPEDEPDDDGDGGAPSPAGSGSPEPNPFDDAGGENRSDADAEATPLVPGQSRSGIGDATAPEIAPVETAGTGGSGSRASVNPSTANRGPRVRTESADSHGSVDAAASVRAAARRGNGTVEEQDLRRGVRSGEREALVVFAVDASASMRAAMRAAKGTVLDLLEGAYRQRDQVAFVAFAGEDAEVLLPPTDSVALAARHLKNLPTGDRTPLPAGLETAAEVVTRSDAPASVVVVVTDGRANCADGSPTAETRVAARRLAADGVHVVVVDASDGDDRTGLAGLVAAESGGEHVHLSALSADRIEQTVAAARES